MRSRRVWPIAKFMEAGVRLERGTYTLTILVA